jgi:hypothetical protein
MSKGYFWEISKDGNTWILKGGASFGLWELNILKTHGRYFPFLIFHFLIYNKLSTYYIEIIIS